MMEHQEEPHHDENPLVEDLLGKTNPALPAPATAPEDHERTKSEEELDPDATSTTTTQTKKKKIPSRKLKSRKKRHREEGGAPSTKSERVLALKMDRYSKLSYQAQKELLKQAKLVRTFLVQKQIRKLKQKSDDDGNTDMTTSSSSSSSLQLLKDLNLDWVVQQAFKQLGVGHANPDPEADFSKNNAPIPMDTTTKSWISTILDHKRFQTALEDWNERVAEFRRFCLQLDDQQNGRFSTSTENQASKKKKGSGKVIPTSLRGQSSQQESQQPISYFCTSLNDDDVDVEVELTEEGGPMSAYGPAATTGGMMDDPTFVVKKNRRGQRARKAKALAIQAKKEGKQYQSINWREEKPKTNTSTRRKPREDKTSSSSGEEQRSQRPPRTTAAPSAPAPSVEDLSQNHPSWAAKQQQKPTIVAFQGKKITFD